MTRPFRLLIVGLPRCGTTLMASLLHQQPGCRFVTDYVAWFADAQDRLQVGWSDQLDMAQRRVSLLMARDAWIRLRHPVLVTTEQFRTLDELHLRIADELAEDAVAVGHKCLLEPDLVDHTLADTDIHVIVMVRDPRAAALSYWHRTGEGVEAYVAQWKEMVARVVRRDHPRLTVLRFEDLLSTPETTLGRVTRWWAAAPELPSSLTFQRGANGARWSENSAFGDVSEFIDTTPVDRWRAQVDNPIVRYADAVCRAGMADMGYDTLHGSMSERMRMRRHELVWAADRRLERAIQRTRRRLKAALAPPLTPRK
ncbi:MAG: sulfotransferase [Sandaracinaceae bacterium]